MGRRKTHDDYLNDVASINPNTLVLDRYVDSKTKIRHECECGNTWLVAPHSFKRKNYDGTCPDCGNERMREKVAKAKTLSHDSFMSRIYNLVGQEYEILGTYRRNDIHIKMKHKTCGYEWDIIPNSFLNNGARCPRCSLERVSGSITKTQEEFISEVKEKHGDRYTVIDKYVRSNKKLTVLCNVCGDIWEVTPNNLLRHNCPNCTRPNYHTNTEKFKERIYRLTGSEYVVLGEYVNALIKIKMQHTLCGYEYEVMPYAFIDVGTRCPKCASSKGEQSIRGVLDYYKINHHQEFTFDDCRNIHPLRFDFSVNDRVLIEYDGVQHFQASFGSKPFSVTQRNDRIKNSYCVNNNIPLIRIPYWEFDNIEYIMKDVLKYFNIIDGECEKPRLVERYYVKNEWNQEEYLAMNGNADGILI